MIPTTMSTLMCRDFLGTHVQPGRSRQRPAKQENEDRNWGSKCFRGSLVCDNKRQSEMRGKCDFLRFIYIPFSLQNHFEVKREEKEEGSSTNIIL